MEHPLVLFDAECVLCTGSIQFIIKNDPKGIFHYASLQHPSTKPLLKQHKAEGLDTVILLKNNKLYTHSTAVLRIFYLLRFPVNLLAFFMVLPVGLRDYFYQIIAKNRQKWFGRMPCYVPNEKEKGRFIHYSSY